MLGKGLWEGRDMLGGYSGKELLQKLRRRGNEAEIDGQVFDNLECYGEKLNCVRKWKERLHAVFFDVPDGC